MWRKWWGRPTQVETEVAETPRPRTDEPPRTPEDEELLDRIAAATVRWGMTVPAIFLLESSKPLNFIGSQFLHFLSPIVHTIFNARELDRFALLLERRETLEILIRRIEDAEAKA